MYYRDKLGHVFKTTNTMPGDESVIVIPVAQWREITKMLSDFGCDCEEDDHGTDNECLTCKISRKISSVEVPDAVQP